MKMRIRSRAMNAECPSFMWQTSGRIPRSFEGADAADTHQDFLLNARAPVSAVQPVRKIARLAGVLG